jgi:mannose-6-phosphate isomerase-like protein (cupin superfamily)
VACTPRQKTRPLPEVPADDKNFSSYQPTTPYLQAGANLLSRTVFAADGPAGYRVEVQDLMVAPHKNTDVTTLPGAAFFEVRYGSGALVEGSKRQEIKNGSTFSVPQGQAFTLENTSELPLVARVHIVMAR